MNLLYLHDRIGDVIVNASEFVCAYGDHREGETRLRVTDHLLLNIKETPAQIAEMLRALD